MRTIKTLLVVSLVVCAAFIAGWRFGLTRETPAVPTPVPIVIPKAKAPAPDAGDLKVSQPGSAPSGALPAPNEADLTLAAAIDSLTSPQSTFAQKQAIREQLRKSGRLEEAIATLKQLATQNPNDPTIATALGEAELSQIRSLIEGGAQPGSSDIAILALQADQSFNAALSADPTNWEAQFEKAAALSHWPPELNKGAEVIQRLSALVTQQEAAPAPQPEFALTYVLLGQQYQAAGQTDKATQILQQGLARYPLNTALQHALNPAANP
jgi:tetratricopeptide (TPR) repeat protein